MAGTRTDFLRMQSIEIQLGTGAIAQPGQQFTVHYTGWLTNGKKFDSSRDRNEPFTFTQGKRQVIAGWDAGFEGMRVGGKRRLFIPYPLAYGEKGRGAIPPKAELIFDVELLGVQDLTPQPAAQDLLNTFNSLSARFLTLARTKVDPKLVWHAANQIKLLTWAARDLPPDDLYQQRVQDYEKREQDTGSRQDAIASFSEAAAALKTQLTPLRSSALDRELRVFGEASTVRGYYLLLITQLSENLGRLSEKP
nr:FKBP-type peptidyl-prolyl cis-trans isomerase [Bryobacter aggregatus]